MSGKVLLTWRHQSMRQLCRQRYLADRDSLQAAHAAIAALFFSEFIAEGDIADLAEGDADAPEERRRSSTPHATQDDPLDREIIKEEEEEEDDTDLIREEEEEEEAVEAAERAGEQRAEARRLQQLQQHLLQQQQQQQQDDDASDKDSQGTYRVPCRIFHSVAGLPTNFARKAL